MSWRRRNPRVFRVFLSSNEGRSRPAAASAKIPPMADPQKPGRSATRCRQLLIDSVFVSGSSCCTAAGRRHQLRPQVRSFAARAQKGDENGH